MANEKQDPGKSGRGVRGLDKAVRRKSRTLTAEQFAAVEPFLVRLSAERKTAARMVMVEKAKMQDVADLFGWPARQSVDRAVASVWAKFLELEEARAKLEAAEKNRQVSSITMDDSCEESSMTQHKKGEKI